MTTRASEVMFEITANDRADRDRQLNAAVAIAQDHAMHERRRGILVTSHGYNAFTVTLSDEVPFGQTFERRTC